MAIQVAQQILQDVNLLTNYSTGVIDDDVDVDASSNVT